MDILVFFLIAILGVLLSVIISKTNKKRTEQTSSDHNLHTIPIWKYNISLIVILYFFRVIMISAVGILTSAYEQVVTGMLCVFIPLGILIFLHFKQTKQPTTVKQP